MKKQKIFGILVVLGLLATMLMALVPMNASAGELYCVHGVVKDSSGVVVSGATIKTQNLETLEWINTTTGSDGSYSVTYGLGDFGGTDCDDDDRIKITATYGTNTKTTTVTVDYTKGGGDQVNLQFPVAPAAVVTEDEVVPEVYTSATAITIYITIAIVVAVVLIIMFVGMSGKAKTFGKIKKKGGR